MESDDRKNRDGAQAVDEWQILMVILFWLH